MTTSTLPNHPPQVFPDHVRTADGITYERNPVGLYMTDRYNDFEKMLTLAQLDQIAGPLTNLDTSEPTWLEVYPQPVRSRRRGWLRR